MTQKRASKTAALERAYDDELKMAAFRIGKDSFESAAWLVQFAQTPIDALSQGALIDLGYDLNYLADFRLITGELPYWGVATTEKDWDGRRRFEGEGKEDNLKPILLGERYRPPMDRPSLDQCKSLQNFVAGLIAGRLERSSFYLELPPLTVVAVFPKDPITSTSVIMAITLAESPRILFTHNVAYLLFKHAARIRQCPNCQRIFFADRKNKMHCSSKCQNTAAVKRLRQEASDLKSKRDAEKAHQKLVKPKGQRKKGPVQRKG
jgi:hypothetical protein